MPKHDSIMLLVHTLILPLLMATTMIFNFSTTTDDKQWQIVDDVVMGGVSSGKFTITPEGHGAFYGHVSTKNNGGFSSVRHRCKPVSTTPESVVYLRVKGDGKNYQFRIKTQSNEYYSYITTFATTGDWETISIPLKSLYPSFRGRKLDMPNFNADSFEEITFLIANKLEEDFELLIDYISIEP